MAKRKPSKKTTKKSASALRKSSLPSPFDSPDAFMNEMMSQGMSKESVLEAFSHLMGSLEIMPPSGFEAGEFDFDDSSVMEMSPEELDQRRAEIDKKLKRSPNNVDLLEERARLSDTPEDSIDFQRRATAAAEKKLGDFTKFEGSFWIAPQTRRYMSSRLNLALTFVDADRIDEALVEYEGLLALNPEDHQGVRYRLLKHYVDRQNWPAAEALISQFPDDVLADIRFTAALLEFHAHGDSAKARVLLKQAMECNCYAVNELLCEPNVPESEDEEDVAAGHMQIGGLSEAQDHATGFRAGWKMVPGAISWLRTASYAIDAELAAAMPKKKPRKVSAATLNKRVNAAMAQIAELPESEESWVLDYTGRPDESEWNLIVADAENLTPIDSITITANPSPSDIALRLCELMEFEDARKEAYRPQLLYVVNDDILEPLQELFSKIDIDVEMHERAEELRRLSEQVFNAEELPDTPLTEIDQRSEVVWEVDWRRADTWIKSDSGELSQPWVIMVVEVESESILQTAMQLEEVTPETLDTILRRAVLLPACGEPHRPGLVLIRSGDNKLSISNWLDEAEVEFRIADLPTIDSIYERMKDDLFTDSRSGLIDIEGVTPELIGELFEVAALYFRAAPWRTMRATDVVAVTCPSLSPKPWYVVGMGQNGESLGFMIFNDSKTVRSMFSSLPGDIGELQGYSLTLEEQHMMAPSDVAAADQFGWPVASAESWPMYVRVSGDEGMLNPTLEDIPLGIVMARVILEFWKSPSEARARGTAPIKMSVPLADQLVDVTAQIFKI